MDSKNENLRPVVKGVPYFLAHVPSMVRHGSKPSREMIKDPSILTPILDHLEDFNQAVAYPPNQTFIGNLDPDDLRHLPSPCLALMPLVEGIEKEYNGKLKVAKVNAVGNRMLCAKLRVMGLPTFLFYKGGVEINRLTGENITKNDLIEAIKKVIS